MKQKRILAIIPTFLPRVGGAELLCLDILSRLVKKGYEIDLITPHIKNSPKSLDFEVIDGVNIHRVNKHLQFGLSRHLVNQFFQIKKAISLSKTNNYDLIHCFYVFASGITSSFLRYYLKIPLLMMLTGQDIYDPIQPVPKIFHPYMRYCMKKAQKITAISKDQKFHGEKISKRSDITIINPGIDIDKFKPSNKEPDQKAHSEEIIILTVKRLYPRGGLEDIIEIANKCAKKNKNIKFMIAGKGPLKDKLQKTIDKYNIQDNVKLLGFVPDKELVELYARSDIFALTSNYEGFGIVYIEAMSSGKPVIAYDAGATSEVVINEKTGFLIEKGDIDSFSNKILELAKNKAKLEEFGKKARERAIKEFDWQKIIDKFDKIYQELIDQ